MKETNDIHGNVRLVLQDRTGKTVSDVRFKNRIVTTGRRMVAEFFSGSFAGSPPTAVTHMAIGTDGSDTADTDVTLGAQRGERKGISSVQLSEITEDGVRRVQVALQAVFDFTEANDPNVPLREAAIFNAESGGVMYNRVVFEPVTKTDAFKLTLFWDIVF